MEPDKSKRQMVKSQTDPCVFLLVQLELWLMLFCLLAIHVLVTCEVTPSAEGCPNPSPLHGHTWHVLACSCVDLWMWLAFRRSFPLCGPLIDMLAFIIPCLLLAAQGSNTHSVSAWAAACLSEVSFRFCFLG